MTTIDLATGIERPSDPKDYITKVAAVAAAKPGTLHPLWDDFLNRVTNNNSELIDFLQRFFGYCMTGQTKEHVLVFLYGTGANGKGVFVNTVSGILGDYAIIAPMDLRLSSLGTVCARCCRASRRRRRRSTPRGGLLSMSGQAKRDELARRYAEYPKLVARLVDLFGSAKALDEEVSRVNGSAPPGRAPPSAWGRA